MDPIVLICSVELEARPLIAGLSDGSRLVVGGRPAYRGRLGTRDVLLLQGGMGKTNAAQTLTAALERFAAPGVIGFGVGGAYDGSGLAPGDLAIASSEHYGDEGVDTPTGWTSCEGIGIPLLESEQVRYFNDFPVDPHGLSIAMRALPAAAAGPFVTVSTCSGTLAGGAVLRDRFGAICETMEGAAYAHVAAHYEVPFLEVRGISNLVEDRDLSRWQLRRAASTATAAAARIVSAWDPHSPPTDHSQ